MEGLVTSAVLALTAVGLSLTFGIMRVVNVAHGEFFMLGAVLAWFMGQWVPGPPAAAFAVALVLCPLIVAAVAVATDWLILALALLGLVWLLLTRTKIGLIMRATQIDRTTARAFGINVDRVYAGVFGLGAALAAIAAVLVVPIQQAHYLMGGDPLLLSFTVVIIGGLGSLRGTLVAALIIGLMDGLLSTAFFFPPTFAKIVATLLVALVLVFRPLGLFGKRSA